MGSVTINCKELELIQLINILEQIRGRYNCINWSDKVHDVGCYNSSSLAGLCWGWMGWSV